jgi:phage gp46-like protein
MTPVAKTNARSCTVQSIPSSSSQMCRNVVTLDIDVVAPRQDRKKMTKKSR